MTARRALRREAVVEGAGLFTGAPCRATIRPAAPGRGVWFLRGTARIPAAASAISGDPVHPAFARSARSTNLGSGSARALTVEHALSALAGLGVTDAEIELTSDEVPILDGSALDFVMAIGAAGIVETGAVVEPVVLAEPVTVQRGSASITASPRSSAGWSIRYELDYGPGAPIAPQVASWDGASATYTRDIAPARTFCTDEEALAMRQAGLFAHLAPKDMLVIGPGGPIDNTLRFADEPARHKLLDVIGDLALVGRPIQADIVARRSGHALNHEMAMELVARS